MGCISSKLTCTADVDLDSEKQTQTRIEHVVSLKSTTYGVLNLDPKRDLEKEEEKRVLNLDMKRDTEKEKEKEKRDLNTNPKWEFEKEEEKLTIKESKKVPVSVLILPQQSKKRTNSKEEIITHEVINAWEIMEGLEEDEAAMLISSSPFKKHNKSSSNSFNLCSPKKINRKKVAGKENSPLQRNSSPSGGNLDVNRVLRPFSSLPNSRLGTPNIPNCPNTTSILKKNHDGVNCSSSSSSSRRSLVPLFDPDLIASIERELCQEKEQIKQIITATPKTREADKLLKAFEEKCPPGGENSLVLYATTLRGIRKTFEDCNTVRSAIESHGVQIMERDISMDSGYREELRVLLKEVKVPMLFVKGRLIGGVDQVVKLEEEGKLGRILHVIPKAKMCEGCAGFRFVMCKVCNGSRKVFEKDENGKIVSEKGQKIKMVRCEKCNENGLVKCPICC